MEHMERIKEAESSSSDEAVSARGGFRRHNSAPSPETESKKEKDELKFHQKPAVCAQADYGDGEFEEEGTPITAMDGRPAPLPPLPSLPVIDMSESQLIGTVDVRSSLAVAQERRRGLTSEPSLDLDDWVQQDQYPWEIEPKKLVLKDFIAKGTYGTVHRGCYDGKDVAVKLLDWGADDAAGRAELTEVRKAFIQEVSVWSTLDHKNVTQFIGACLGGAREFHIPSHVNSHGGKLLVEGHVSCVVLEYLPGGSLKQLLLAYYHKKLPLKTVVQYALDIARGLAYLHSKHIVHRDVKSDNMLLDRHKVVKIADFGVSRVEDTCVKRLHHLAGTYGYMAPEVLMGIPYDHKVDVYSFGILLWEIYCCDNPFPFMHFNANDIKTFVSQGLRPEIPSCCPADLATIMRRCWDKNPDKRPDMGEVVTLLEKVDLKHGRGMTHDEFDFLKSQHRPGGGAVAKLVGKLKDHLPFKEHA